MRFGRTLPLFLLVFLLGCTTKLVKVDTDSRPVSPTKARLVADLIPPGTQEARYRDNPCLSVTVRLRVKQPAGYGIGDWTEGLRFLGNPGGLFVWAVESSAVTVARSDGSGVKTLRTGYLGELKIDLRDFYAHDPPESALRLTVTLTHLGLSREVTIRRDYVAKARNYEDRASVLLGEAISYEKAGDYSSAFERYAQLLADYPDAKATEQAGVGLERVKQARTEQVRRELTRVSDDKVRAALGRLGLTEYESNSLAGAVESLSSSGAASVTRKGLGLQLDESECAEEYRSLTLFQKFYAILRYANSLGGSAADALAPMLGVPRATAEKLAGLSAQKLLK